MNIFTLPQQLPNSAYTLISTPVTTPVNVNNNVYLDQEQFRDNDVKQITFAKTTKVQ
jgi:hypothetical protein